jgi:hypothetical protein
MEAVRTAGGFFCGFLFCFYLIIFVTFCVLSVSVPLNFVDVPGILPAVNTFLFFKFFLK